MVNLLFTTLEQGLEHTEKCRMALYSCISCNSDTDSVHIISFAHFKNENVEPQENTRLKIQLQAHKNAKYKVNECRFQWMLL